MELDRAAWPNQDDRLRIDAGNVQPLSHNEFGYVGRADSQVKIRGYRIEPAEIEAELRQDPDVIDCVVGAADYGGNDVRLVACMIVTEVAMNSRERTIRRLKTALERTLPSYMCPSSYFLRREFPMTENGKLNIAACMETSFDEGARSAHTLVKQVWLQLLERGSIEDDDDFFDLGGTSFTLIKMLRMVNELFNVEIKPDSLSEGATINVIASSIAVQRSSRATLRS